MIVELEGQITESGEWDTLHIGDMCLSDYVEDIDSKLISLKYYISSTPITKESATEKFLKSFYSGLTDVNCDYCYGSEWTGIYAKNDKFCVGEHNIIIELQEHIGKYCYLKIEIDE